MNIEAVKDITTKSVLILGPEVSFLIYKFSLEHFLTVVATTAELLTQFVSREFLKKI